MSSLELQIQLIEQVPFSKMGLPTEKKEKGIIQVCLGIFLKTMFRNLKNVYIFFVFKKGNLVFIIDF